MTRYDVVILGGGYAGLAAARKLRQLAPRASVSLVDERATFFERIRLHEIVAGAVPNSWDYRAVLSAQGVDFTHARLLALDSERHEIYTSIGTLEYGQLIYALGSSSPVVSGAWVPSTPESAIELRTRLEAPAGKVVVVGAGLTGIEFAGELAERYPAWKVTLVAGDALRASEGPGGYAPAAVDGLREGLARLGVDLLEGEGARAERLEQGALLLTSGERLPAEIHVWTVGFAVPDLAARCGLATNPRGQLLTDGWLRSVSHPDIIGVGDAAQAVPTGGQTLRMGSATALAAGLAGARSAAARLGAAVAKPFEFSYLFRNISLGRHDAVVQFVNHLDEPRPQVWVGSRAAKWKEYICLSTLSTCGLQSTPFPPRLPPVRVLPQLIGSMRQYV